MANTKQNNGRGDSTVKNQYNPVRELGMDVISPRLLSIKNAALYLGGITRQAVYTLMKDHGLTSVKINGRRMFDVKDLDKFINRNKQQHKE